MVALTESLINEPPARRAGICRQVSAVCQQCEQLCAAPHDRSQWYSVRAQFARMASGLDVSPAMTTQEVIAEARAASWQTPDGRPVTSREVRKSGAALGPRNVYRALTQSLPARELLHVYSGRGGREYRADRAAAVMDGRDNGRIWEGHRAHLSPNAAVFERLEAGEAAHAATVAAMVEQHTERMVEAGQLGRAEVEVVRHGEPVLAGRQAQSPREQTPPTTDTGARWTLATSAADRGAGSRWPRPARGGRLA